VTRERQGRRGGRPAPRAVDYRTLRHAFPPQAILSTDQVAALHEAALGVLEDLGIRILHPEACALLAGAGAIVDDGTKMVRIGREIVEAALAAAPRRIRLLAANPARARDYAEGELLFAAGAGCPNASDSGAGRRPGSLRDYETALVLQQSFDAIHIHGPSVEPQDIPPALRHYAMMRGQLVLGDKPMFVYARGRRQVEESLEMIRLGLDLSGEDWAAGVWANTVINTNSPRQIDVPMAEGVIDFARAGQMSIITPFCLMGAMAPVTIGGALVLQHAEALACIALAQVARPGAPVSYGGFGSNVDLKSGAPAFGTPDHVRMQIGSGQLARHIGLPWRTAAGSAGNAPDAQAAVENAMGLWGALLANATLCIHSAGWLEGGLTFGFEKFVCDMETVEQLAELCLPFEVDTALEAIADVDPGGHFFSTEHTMARYAGAFRAPLVADLSNFGSWTEAGARTSADRATEVWRRRLAETPRPAHSAAADDRLAPWIEARTRAGGAPPTE
jgi:trimethylamine---corrinoid protein Co-methyltransferase